MSIKSIIKAGLLTASLVAIAAPALAQPREDDRPARGERGGNGGGNENRGGRGSDNGGGRYNGGGRGGEARPAPAPVAVAPAPAPPVVRAAPPVATPAENGRFQRGGNEQPRPGTPQWYSALDKPLPSPRADAGRGQSLFSVPATRAM